MTLGPVQTKWGRGRMRWLAVFVLSFAGWAVACAQDAPATPGTAPSSATGAAESTAKKADAAVGAQEAKAEPKTEVSSRDTETTFKLRVNLVQVKVVVRDDKGELVRDLKREDFQIYDQGKLQAITTFGVETPETRRQRIEAAAKTQKGATEEVAGAATATLPQRFVALVFDDIHLRMEDATFVRVSAKKLVDSMTPADRIGIFGTSEQLKVEYTNDKEVLERALLQVIPRPKMGKINSVNELSGCDALHGGPVAE